MRLEVKDFNLRHTVESGQCFSWENFRNGYATVIDDIFFYIEQNGNILDVEYYSENGMRENDIKKIIEDYFSLNSDYSNILKLINKDEYIDAAIRKYKGIRIINQPHLDCFISFLLSASNTVKNIQNSRLLLSRNYGRLIHEQDSRKFYSFPDFETLKSLTEKEFRACKAGFRAKYIYQALQSIDKDFIESLSTVEYKQAKDKLLQIKGIGEKIADCILLYSYRYHNLYPTDTWVNKFTRLLYFKDEKVKEDEIRKFGINYFNGYAGWAQLLLYIYCREDKNFLKSFSI